MSTTQTPYGEKSARIRKELSLADDKIYFNVGSMGPLSGAAVRAIEQELGIKERNGHASNFFKGIHDLMEQTRKSVAALINADPEEVALKNSTTHGIYEVLGSFAWHEGDEIITSDMEHFAVILPLMQLREQFGVVTKYFETANWQAGAINELMTARTKLVIVSHVSLSNGVVLPVREIVRLAHKKGIPVLVDGAQAVGAIPVDVKELEADYYSLPGQKWLFGPQGSGALYINRAIIDSFHPAVNEEITPYPYEDLKLHTDQRRFEPAPPSHLAAAGFGAGVDWLIRDVTCDYAFRRISELARYLRTELAKVPSVTVVTPMEAAGLTAFYADFADAKTLQRYLVSLGILVRRIDPFGYVRVSTSYFHTEDEIESLIKALRNFPSYQS